MNKIKKKKLVTQNWTFAFFLSVWFTIKSNSSIGKQNKSKVPKYCKNCMCMLISES